MINSRKRVYFEKLEQKEEGIKPLDIFSNAIKIKGSPEVKDAAKEEVSPKTKNRIMAFEKSKRKLDKLGRTKTGKLFRKGRDLSISLGKIAAGFIPGGDIAVAAYDKLSSEAAKIGQRKEEQKEIQVMAAAVRAGENNQKEEIKQKPNYLLYGGIALFVLVVGFILYKSKR